ncbi:MFS transporter [Kitasatospora sp. NBC_01302]|uniref:MFS transporter n=1 Tax=Kitasatospora sp. NBC_01302 TaxID=2903575 RepID=UPI002E13DC5D|nr:MFS transporter [Kitasatospora sp. NBC_01302]
MVTTRTDVTRSRRVVDSAARRRGLGLAGLCLGTALIVMEANVVNVAVPAIRAQLRAGAAAGLWVVDAYTLVLAALLLSAGRLGDRIGPRRGYLIGLGVFGAASVLCALAPGAALLVPARALQGAGAALLAPAPLTLIAHACPGPAERARAVAVWVGVGGVGMVVGPLLGGLLVDTLGWRSIFVLNVPVVAVTWWLVRRYVEELPRRPVAFDPAGQLLAVLGLTAVVWSLVTSARAGWGSPTVLPVLAGGLLALLGLVVAQLRRGRRGHDVLLPPAVLTARPVQAGLLGGAVYNFTLYGMLLVHTFAFQQLRHYSALRTGLAFLPLTLAVTAGAGLLGGRFTERRGPRTALATGMGLSAAGLLVLALGVRHTPYPVTAAGFVLFALGLGLSAPAQTLAVLAHAPEEHRNMASSTLNAARQTGGVLGVALLGAFVAPDVAARTPVAMALAAGCCVGAAVTALRRIPARGSGPLSGVGAAAAARPGSPGSRG